MQTHKTTAHLIHNKLFIKRRGRIWCTSISYSFIMSAQAPYLWCISPEWGFRNRLELHEAWGGGGSGDSSSALMQYSNPAWCCSVPYCWKTVLSHHRPRWLTLPAASTASWHSLCRSRAAGLNTHAGTWTSTHAYRPKTKGAATCAKTREHVKYCMLQAERFNYNSMNKCKHINLVFDHKI